MNVRFTPRALAEAERRRKWWRARRPQAPELFDDELAATVELLETTPSVGASYRASSSKAINRVLMSRCESHLYYATRDGEIVILCVWGARRGRGPTL